MKLNAHLMARMVRMLVEGPCMAREIVDETGLAYCTVISYLQALHRQKAVHICGWERDVMGRAQIKVYAFGEHKDTPRPRLTDAQKQAAYKSRRQLNAAQAALTGAQA